MNIVEKYRSLSDDAVVNPAIACLALDVAYTKLVQVLRNARIISPYSRSQEFRLGDARRALAEEA